MADLPHTTTGNDIDPRARLRALYHELEQLGARIPLVDIDALPDGTIRDMCHHAEHRLSAIHEGLRNGWTPPPDWDTHG